jgi:hypothetical protein
VGVTGETSKTCLVQLRAYPGSDPAMWDALYAARDGKGIRVSGKLHNKPVEDEEGNLYFVPVNNGSGPINIDFASWQGGRWLKYNPRRNRLEDLGFVDRGVGVYALAIDAKRRRLFGLGFTGYLYRFDLDRRVTTNLGRVSNWDVCRTIVCDDEGNVYGSFPTARVWKYDAKTERVDDLPLRIPFDPAVYPTQLQNPMIDRSCDWRAVTWDPVDRAVYGVTCGSGSILFRLNPHAPVDRAVVALGRLCDTSFLEGQRQDVPYSPLAFAVDSPARQVYFVPSPRSYSPGAYAETFGSDEPHHLIVYDLARKQRFDCGALRTAAGRRVFGCEAASVGPDGTLYLCGQAEVRDPAQATGRAGRVPVALHLVLYRPHP